MDRQFRLPVRLLPRRRAQIPAIIGFGFFLGFTIFWTINAASTTGATRVSDPSDPEFWLSYLFPLFGAPFILVGAAGIATAILKLLPGSPYYHLEVNADGLLIRSLCKQRRHPWRDLPAFETLEHRRRTKNGTRVTWFTVAVETAPLEPGMDVGANHQREVLRIDADEYGAKNGQQDALELAAWLNGLRALALDERLSAHERVEVPAGFAANAIVAAGRPGTVKRTPTVVRG